MNGVRKTGTAESSFIAIVVAAALVAALCSSHACAIEARLMKETAGTALVGAPCALPTSTDGTAANYRWYNVCSGYIWIFHIHDDESTGVLFGGPEQPEVNDSNVVKRAITYYRNIVPSYSQTVDVFVEPDLEGDGCPDAAWLSDLSLDPGLRWNCSEFNAPILSSIEYLVVRWMPNGGFAPNTATDGPFNQECAPIGAPRSFYYWPSGSGCVPWIGPNERSDNFLFWLIVDQGAANATQQSSWGAIKGLFR